MSISDSSSNHPYSGREIILTSKHEKLNHIRQAFDDYLDCKLLEISLDTDQLGTFSGEIERVAPPRETAILKARLGMNATGISIGIASEGSIGPDPIVGFIHSDIEHLVLVDDENEIVISEMYRSFDISVATITTAPGQELENFLKAADFPNHRLIVRPNSEEIIDCIKGISDRKELSKAIAMISKTSPDGLVVIESDLRAMYSPTRQKNIEEVARLLATRVSQLCPDCKTPGWGRVGYETGLICSDCDSEKPTAIRQEILGCVKCEFSQLGVEIASRLNPAQCDFCNP